MRRCGSGQNVELEGLTVWPRGQLLIEMPTLKESAFDEAQEGTSSSPFCAAGAEVPRRTAVLPARRIGHAGPARSRQPKSGRVRSSFPGMGLPRYQHHSTPVCDRKDFVLNFNGISSFHPSASGPYYHHHHHQSVCQDIKPCVM
ncbi:hypothetical protein E5288_WYG020304 [Bos mutus]|uniref:Uncharacterized protein n=1 Tax=Bos mutus TaxID=72004 RepID=A0A6B0SHF1_9CETA|nr:hypothetical protein [Bos mutus]